MIVDAILEAFFGIIYSFLGLLPNSNSTVTSGLQTAINNFMELINTVDSVFPFNTLFQVIGLILIVEVSYLVYTLVIGVIKLK